MKAAMKSGGHVIDLLFTLALFCVFTASSLLVVLIGANVYKGTVSGMTTNYDIRTTLTYISQKVRQNDLEGGIRIDKIADSKALVLEQNYNDTTYETWIYYDNGYIKELFTRKGNKISKDGGREIIPISDFNIECDENEVYTFTITDKYDKTAFVKSFSRCSDN